MTKLQFALIFSLFAITGCSLITSHDSRKEWAKGGATKQGTKAQLKNCKQYLVNVHPKKQRTILTKCMNANGFIRRRT